MRLSIVRLGILLTSAALSVSAATAQTELFFATGVDSTGWAQAQSNADGHVLIESPQYPRGLWLHLVDEAGDALAGLQVEYQGRPDSLVAIRCVDLADGVRETLVWSRPSGEPLLLTLKPKEAADLPVGLGLIDWQIDPSAASLLGTAEETRLIGWEAVAAFLRERWQSQAARVAVQLNTSTNLAVELDNPDALETLVAYLQQAHQSAGTSPALYVQVFRGGLPLLEGATLYIPFNILLFEDSNLQNTVRQALGGSQGSITPQRVASLTKLVIGPSGIHSLVGLGQLTNLEFLWLSENQIVDVSPLVQLTNLEFLLLSGNQIADVTPLAQLTNLKWLMLSTNQIADVSPLAQLTNLEELNLSANQIADITPLAQLTNLEELHLSYNRIADVSPLAQLTNLEELNLFRNPITDVTPLAKLTNLSYLFLGANQVADVTPLAKLTNLEDLYMDYNYRLVDVTPLAKLTNLIRLSLSHNPIADVTPLAKLINLEDLYMAYNQIEDVASLVTNTGLGEGDRVNLENNPLSDQARNEQIPSLQARGVDVRY